MNVTASSSCYSIETKKSSGSHCSTNLNIADGVDENYNRVLPFVLAFQVYQYFGDEVVI